MGVVVTGPGRFDPALLPPMPPDPATVNLNVTTLCALVSEVSNGDPTRPELQQWAQRVVHWQVGRRKLLAGIQASWPVCSECCILSATAVRVMLSNDGLLGLWFWPCSCMVSQHTISVRLLHA